MEPEVFLSRMIDAMAGNWESKREVPGETAEEQKEREAQNRRNLLASLKDEDTRDFTRREFAKLGLYQ